ncbi:TPA: AAA family ATPase [Streptococcus suis]
MKIKSIVLENYKSYALKTTVNFSNLNIITGTNSSGKSSMIETLLILGQINEFNVLNGRLKKLGGYDNLINNQLSGYPNIRLNYSFDDTEEQGYEVVISKQEINKPQITTIPKVVYLSAERIGILNSYNKNRDIDYFSPKGEELLSLLYEKSKSSDFFTNNNTLFNQDNKIREVFDRLPVEENDNTKQLILESQNKSYIYNGHKNAELLSIVNFWLEEFTGYTVEIEEISTQLLNIKYRKGDKFYEPQHIGTGVTFILFQLVALLASPEETIVIIENPEIHLHPSLQSNLMYFYQWISESGRQIFIETHSDHIFNVSKIIKADKGNGDCTILFSQLTQKQDIELGEVLSTEVFEIEIDDRGDLVNYPDGLFDQYSVDSAKYYHLIFSRGG